MSSNGIMETGDSIELAQHALEQFLHSELPTVPFSNLDTGIYLFCHLMPEGEPSRRILVVSDQQSQVVRVCIEASYELFKGSIHHHVQRIGTVNRDEVRDKLEPLVREAYAHLIAWKPTHENIWDYDF